MRLSAFALFAAAAIAGAHAAEIDSAEADHLADFWSKFDGWKWNCSAWKTKKEEGEMMEVDAEPEWLGKEWVGKMLDIKYHKHNHSDWEAGKLAKMWSICDWFKFKLHKNHTHEPAFAEEAEMEAVNEAAAEKADEAFLMDFFKACSAWKHNKTWTWGFHKKNFTWFKTHKEGEDMTASIEN